MSLPSEGRTKVFITVDTEFWPDDWDLRESGVQKALERDIYGWDRGTAYGLPKQFEILDRYGLKAAFFVEALCGEIWEKRPLQEVVSMVLDAGQEVQLHIHTEWNERLPKPIIPDRSGMHMHHFSEDEQAKFIEVGIQNLLDCGVDSVNAFRAGNYGANWATLRALARNNIEFDTSFNWCYLGTDCLMDAEEPYHHPVSLEGVIEVPISFFQDFPRHVRHAQLCACSFSEMSFALLQAWERKWPAFTIVSHSFELLNPTREKADSFVVRRFEKLCQFLAENDDKFEVVGFNGLDFGSLDDLSFPHKGLKSTPLKTVRRIGEQALRRLF